MANMIFPSIFSVEAIETLVLLWIIVSWFIGAQTSCEREEIKVYGKSVKLREWSTGTADEAWLLEVLDLQIERLA